MVVQVGPVPATNEQNQAKQNLALQQLFAVTASLLTQGTTFANLPSAAVPGSIAYVTDGLAGNCADGSCTTWGTNVTGGTGALKLLVWWNGAHWTLIGK